MCDGKQRNERMMEILRQTRSASKVDAHKEEADLFALASQRIRDKILQEGVNLGHGILKVNSFVNHRVDVGLMDLCGHALADRFKGSGVTLVLTAQTSGVLPAQACARYLEKPMIFAREKRPITMAGGAYEARSKSHTKGNDVSLFVATEFIAKDDRVLVVDDFLASGTTAVALLDIVRQAGAKCVGFAFLIEKSFEGGRNLLEAAFTGPDETAIPIACLADVVALEESGEIKLGAGRS